jgi:hypothetical protein
MTPEFAKSRVGKKFLEFDVPRLAEAMEKLATAINESNKIEEKKLLIEQKRYLNERKDARTTGSGEDRIESEPQN